MKMVLSSRVMLLLLFSILLAVLLYGYTQKYLLKNSRVEPFYQDVYLTDSELPLERNPEYLLPSNNTVTVPQPGGSNQGADLYKDDKIKSYVTSTGSITFKRSEIEKGFSDQLAKFPKQPDESEESYLSRFMVPILWQATKNQFASFSELDASIQKIKTELRTANVSMVSINKEVSGLGEAAINSKRAEDFDFKKF